MFAFWGPQFLYENTKAHSPLKTFGLRIHLAAKPNYLEGLYISHLDWIFCLAAEKLSVGLFSGPLTIRVWAVQIHLYRFFSIVQFNSVQFSRSVMSDSLQPHGLQHTRLPCPSPTPRTCSNSYPLSWWCHPTISSFVVPFYSCLQSFPASGPFQMSQFFASGGQSIVVSAFQE